MPRISFTANLQRHLALAPTEVPGRTVAAALDRIFTDNPRLRSYLLDDQGRLRKHVAIYVNREPVRDRQHLSDPIESGDEVFVFQALSGG